MLAKDKLNIMEISVSTALVDPYITDDQRKFVSVNNILKEYDDLKKRIKIRRTQRYIKKQYVLLESYKLNETVNKFLLQGD